MLRFLRLWRVAGRDLRLLWFALKHRSRPLWLLPAAILIGFYAVEPFNFAVPVLGVVDDQVLLPLLLHLLLRCLPKEIRDGFARGTRV
jgi:uncharacterized membrane protein YkvA (DUF1232 family)